MKKLFLKITLSFVLILSYSSCSQEEITQDATSLDGITIDLSHSRLGQQIVLAEYKNKKELESKIVKVINQLLNDSNEFIEDNEEVTNVVTSINFSNGQVFITDIIYYNDKKNTIVDSYTLNTNTNSYQRAPVPYTANCPEGYTQIASCSNFDNPQSCVSSAVASFLTENISGPGDCANVQVSVGTFKTKVCGKTC